MTTDPLAQSIKEQIDTFFAYYENLRTGGYDHQHALAWANVILVSEGKLPAVDLLRKAVEELERKQEHMKALLDDANRWERAYVKARDELAEKANTLEQTGIALEQAEQALRGVGESAGEHRDQVPASSETHLVMFRIVQRVELALATLAGRDDERYIFAEEDARCGAIHPEAQAVCLLARGHKGSHRNTQGYWLSRESEAHVADLTERDDENKLQG